MKRTVIIATLVLVLGFSMIVQGQKQPGNWEYANIQYDSFGVWFWKEPSLFVEGEEIKDIFRQLSIDIPPNKNPELYLLVKWAGDNGWELVSMDQRVSYTSVWFKRKS